MNINDLKRQLAAQLMQQRAHAQNQQGNSNEAYRDFSASELYCPKCKQAMPVREKMLLVLASGELFDYVCEKCGTSLGTRTT